MVSCRGKVLANDESFVQQPEGGGERSFRDGVNRPSESGKGRFFRIYTDLILSNSNHLNKRQDNVSKLLLLLFFFFETKAKYI